MHISIWIFFTPCSAVFQVLFPEGTIAEFLCSFQIYSSNFHMALILLQAFFLRALLIFTHSFLFTMDIQVTAGREVLCFILSILHKWGCKLLFVISFWKLFLQSDGYIFIVISPNSFLPQFLCLNIYTFSIKLGIIAILYQCRRRCCC